MSKNRRAETIALEIYAVGLERADVRSVKARRDTIVSMLKIYGYQITDLSVPPTDQFQASLLSNARVGAMELGLSPWPSASGWAPMDLPWKERRILIGIVEGVASLARWAHDIWLRDHQPFADCCDCGDPVCSESCPP
jgi:hypothetical protein